MLFSARITLGQLAGLCRRLAISLEAGIDVRTVWAREAQRPAHPACRKRLRTVSQRVHQGDSLGEALAATGDYFPLLFRELAVVGEQTGHLSECFAQLADHYEGQLRLRRMFLAAIAWPALQLAVALLVVGFLIWIMGLIADITGQPVDILGFGLVGNAGLAVYVSFLAVIGAVLVVFVRAAGRGMLWTQPVQLLLARLPVLGPVLQTLALARLAWSLHLTLDTGMDLRRGLALSLQSTRNAYFTQQIPRIDKAIAAGESLHEAFRRCGVFPPEFLDALHAGEQAGRVVETMRLLSRQYQDRAQAAVKVLTMLAGFAVWAVIAALIIFLIFRIFSFYLGAINDALRG